MSESSIWEQDSVKRAEQWIDSYVSQGYNATQALSSYREQGGSIRSAWWYEAFREKAATPYKSEFISNEPGEYTVASRLWTPTAMDYTEQFVWKAVVRPIDANGVVGEEIGITLESDDRYRTLDQWRAEMLDVLQHSSGPSDTVDFEIVEDQWLERE